MYLRGKKKKKKKARSGDWGKIARMLIRVFGFNKGQREFICKIVSLASVWDFPNVVIRVQPFSGSDCESHNTWHSEGSD